MYYPIYNKIFLSPDENWAFLTNYKSYLRLLVVDMNNSAYPFIKSSIFPKFRPDITDETSVEDIKYFKINLTKNC